MKNDCYYTCGKLLEIITSNPQKNAEFSEVIVNQIEDGICHLRFGTGHILVDICIKDEKTIATSFWFSLPGMEAIDFVFNDSETKILFISSSGMNAGNRIFYNGVHENSVQVDLFGCHFKLSDNIWRELCSAIDIISLAYTKKAYCNNQQTEE